MNNRRKWILQGVAAVFVTISTTGCGSSSTQADQQTGTSAAANTTAASSDTASNCKDAPADVVNQILGTSYGDPKSSKDGSAIICTYKNTSDQTSATVRFDNPLSHDAFLARKAALPSQGTTTYGLNGVGDEGFGTTEHPDAMTTLEGVAGWKNNEAVTVTAPRSIYESKKKDLVNRLLG
jgi:hypothetical protein